MINITAVFSGVRLEIYIYMYIHASIHSTLNGKITFYLSIKDNSLLSHYLKINMIGTFKQDARTRCSKWGEFSVTDVTRSFIGVCSVKKKSINFKNMDLMMMYGI